MSAGVTLYIDLSDSRCGACGKNADPYEAAHVMESMRGDGCGAIYSQVSSHYFDAGSLYSRIREMRPDLEFVNPELAS